MGKRKVNDPCWCGSGTKYKKCHMSLDMDIERERSLPIDERVAKTVVRGEVTPMRSVPHDIDRPSYAETGVPADSKPSLVKTPDEIERMRYAGKVARVVLDTVGAAVAPGVTTEELDKLAHETYIANGAYPSTLNYHGFTKTICTSVNEVIVHGIPDSRPLQEGDIVSCDITAFVEGVHGDCCATFPVGAIDDPSARLIAVTYECLRLGIEAVRPAARMRDIGKAIQPYAEKFGFGVVRQFVGHGIGTVFHMEPQVPHYYDKSATLEMLPGITFTIEPMITMGDYRSNIWDDDWTAVTVDFQRAAQFEHTCLVTETGVEVLTKGAHEDF